MTEPQKHELELLKGAANEPYEKGKGKWSRLLKVLQLSTIYVPAIQEILKQGKWQNQPNPIGYVRKAAVRRAVRHGLVEIRRKRGQEALPPEISSEHERLGEEYKLITELCDLDNQQKRQPLVRILSQEVLNREVVREAEEVDWEKVARLANLDPGERIVLDLKLMGLRWREAIAACLTAADRSILNTAWRRFDRHKNVVKEALLTGKAQHVVRKISLPELDLMFTEGEDGRVKIFFRKAGSR
jgi:hypothetical protein